MADASAQLYRSAATLRASGNRALRLEMTRTLRAQAQPAVSAVRAAARRQLPQRGGLAAEQAEQAIRVSVLTGANTAGVRIRTRTRGSMQTDKGFVRHPVPNTGRWVRQEIPQAEGWWSQTLARQAPAQTVAMRATMNRIAWRVMRGG